ncbi:MAG: hypothetical protein M3082_07180 [Candidatus Dormibacteraeota bacterium]|nr:hypothetical protein [Candidatus Dormibacteraeota bacterium]
MAENRVVPGYCPMAICRLDAATRTFDRRGKWGLAVLATVAFSACSGGVPAADHRPADLSRMGAEQLMLRGDEVRRSAFDSPRTSRLAAPFRGRALQALEAQVQVMAWRGLREEEQNATRALVFWDPHAGEAVLQVIAQHRVVAADQPQPPWAATIRQWWARFQCADGRWWIVDQLDLPPDRWRPVAPSG